MGSSVFEYPALYQELNANSNDQFLEKLENYVASITWYSLTICR